MAVLNQISVGDIMYYQVDDIPTHSAPKGSVAILNTDNYENSYLWVNNGNTTWLKSITPSYSKMFISNNTVGVDFDSQTIGEWYSFTNETYTTEIVEDFEKIVDPTFGDALKYTGNTLSRMYAIQSSTLRGGPDKWMSWNVGPSQNFIIPTEYNGGFVNDNAATTNIGSGRILDLITSDNITCAISPVAREAGGGPASRTYIPRHAELTIVKIDKALKKIFFNEGWESSGFTENSWTVVNDTNNVWVVGQAENNGGTSSAYVSDDGGTTASYTITSADVSHFYKDFTFNSSLDRVYLEFDWKCQGENAAGATQYDYGAVVITTTGTTPVAGTEVSTTQATDGGNGRIGADDNLGKFNLNYGTNPGTTWNTERINLSDYIGQTKRIVFTWNNDGSVGTDPPFVVDNIKITEFKF